MTKDLLIDTFLDVLKWCDGTDAWATAHELAERFSHWSTVDDPEVGEVELWWIP